MAVFMRIKCDTFLFSKIRFINSHNSHAGIIIFDTICHFVAHIRNYFYQKRVTFPSNRGFCIVIYLQKKNDLTSSLRIQFMDVALQKMP